MSYDYDDEENQGRGPSPVTNSITDLLIATICAGSLFFVLGLAVGVWQ